MSLVYKDFDVVTISNTVTPTELFKFDFAENQSLNNYANEYWGPGKSFRLTMFGYINQNVGAGTPNASFEAFLGATTLSGLNADMPGGFPYFKLVYTMYAKGGTHSQYSNRELYVGDTGANAGDERFALSSVPQSIDLLANPVLTVKCTLSVASASFEISRNFVTIEFI